MGILANLQMLPQPRQLTASSAVACPDLASQITPKAKAIRVAWFCDPMDEDIVDQLEVGLRNLVYNALLVAELDPLVLESSMKVRQTLRGINRDQNRFQIYIQRSDIKGPLIERHFTV
jgi:hypothetical protein